MWYRIMKKKLVGSLYWHKKPPAGIQCFGHRNDSEYATSGKVGISGKIAITRKGREAKNRLKSIWMLNSAISYSFLLSLTLVLKDLLGFGTLIISWEGIHHFSHEKENKIQIMEKNVTEDSASSLKAIKFISLKA